MKDENLSKELDSADGIYEYKGYRILIYRFNSKCPRNAWARCRYSVTYIENPTIRFTGLLGTPMEKAITEIKELLDTRATAKTTNKPFKAPSPEDALNLKYRKKVQCPET